MTALVLPLNQVAVPCERACDHTGTWLRTSPLPPRMRGKMWYTLVKRIYIWQGGNDMEFLSPIVNAIIQVIIFAAIPFVRWLVFARKKQNFFIWIELKPVKLTDKESFQG